MRVSVVIEIGKSRTNLNIETLDNKTILSGYISSTNMVDVVLTQFLNAFEMYRQRQSFQVI